MQRHEQHSYVTVADRTHAISLRSWTAMLAIMLLGAVLVFPAYGSSVDASADPQDRPEKPARPEPEGKYGKEANPGTIFKETRGRSSLHSRGLEMRELHGRAAGKPVASLPGAKSIGRSDWQNMTEIPKTGLYLVDLDHIPPGLEEDLKKNDYRLTADGTLTKSGNPVALFVVGETYRVKPQTEAGPSADKPSGEGEGLAQRASRFLLQLAGSVDSLITSDAEAATPFPWRCFSWSFRWEYDGGFCRDYKAWSSAYSWGPGADGFCADPKPLTRIEYISTYVNNSGRTDWDYHYNADQSHSYAKWDIGCFWPAHGSGSGYHYAYWRDGSAWAYRTWSW